MATADKQRWTCPGCNKAFNVPAGKKLPELCPECRQQAPESRTASDTGQSQPPGHPGYTEPLAVVFPQFENERWDRWYWTTLTWQVVRFWFVIFFLPASFAGFGIDPGVGMLSLAIFVGVYLWLCWLPEEPGKGTE